MHGANFFGALKHFPRWLILTLLNYMSYKKSANFFFQAWKLKKRFFSSLLACKKIFLFTWKLKHICNIFLEIHQVQNGEKNIFGKAARHLKNSRQGRSKTREKDVWGFPSARLIQDTYIRERICLWALNLPSRVSFMMIWAFEQSCRLGIYSNAHFYFPRAHCAAAVCNSQVQSTISLNC